MDQECVTAVKILCNSSSLVHFHLKTKAKALGGKTDETCTGTFNNLLCSVKGTFSASVGMKKPVKWV